MTDDFTTAAREAARKRLSGHDFQFGNIMRPMVWMAEWARDHVAAQDPTNAAKDAAMDALGCELRVVENGQTTCDVHGGYATSEDVCEVVEVALNAAKETRR